MKHVKPPESQRTATLLTEQEYVYRQQISHVRIASTFTPTLPTKRESVYWPTSSYGSDSKLAISYDTNGNTDRDNSGFGTQDFSENAYAQALADTGAEGEAVLKILFLERTNNGDINARDPVVHDGPTLILVETSGGGATAVMTAAPTTTAQPSTVKMMPTIIASNIPGVHVDSDDEDDGPDLHPGAIAGIVIGAIAAIVALIFVCCRACCCGIWKRRRNTDQGSEQPHTIEQGEGMVVHSSAPEGKGADGFIGAVSGVFGPASGSKKFKKMEEAKVQKGNPEVERSSVEGPPPPKYSP